MLEEVNNLQNMSDILGRYNSPSIEIQDRLYQSAKIILDTNILLGLDEIKKEERDKVLAILETKKSQLVLPAQVAVEYGNKMISTWRKEKDTHDNQVKNAKSAINILKTLSAAGHLPALERSSLLKELETYIKSPAVNSEKHQGTSRLLELLFQGRVRREFSDEELEELKCEFNERIEAPGKCDSNKPDGGVGDYIIWKEILEEVEEGEEDVLFVTNDSKSDWVTLGLNGKNILGLNLNKESKGRVYLVRQEDFLLMAQRLDAAAIDSSDIEAIKMEEQESENEESESKEIANRERRRLLAEEIRRYDTPGYGTHIPGYGILDPTDPSSIYYRVAQPPGEAGLPREFIIAFKALRDIPGQTRDDHQ